MRAIALLGLIILILQVTRLYSSTIILYAISIFLNKYYILNFSLMFQNADIYVKYLNVDISTPKWTQKGTKGHMI